MNSNLDRGIILGEQSNSAPSWVIVCTNAVDRTEVDMLRIGYRVYLPRYRRRLSPHGADRRIATAMRPVFAGMLFAQDWRGWPQASISGEPRLMRAIRGGNPATICDGDVALMQRREREGAFDDVSYPAGLAKPPMRTDLKIGQTVTAERFGDRIVAVLEDLSENGIAIVRWALLGRENRTTIAAAELDVAVQG